MLERPEKWKRRRRYPIRPGIEKPGDLVELDTIHFVDKHGERTYVYTAIDVYSRYGYAKWYKRANTHSSVAFLRQAKKYFPFRISCIQTDNGSEFGRWFTDRALVPHRHNHPRSPNENGHLERFNRTLQEEIPKHGLTIYRRDHVSRFLSYYNKQRLHMGINFKTPAQLIQK